MSQPRILILRAPGTNCDAETAFAFQRAGGRPDVVHVRRLLENPTLPRGYQVLCLPGGFSYGDDIAAGRILAGQIRHHLADVLRQFQADGKLILGICNGFQVLIRSGLLLPDHPQAGPAATLTWNDSGRFEARWVELVVRGSRCVMLQGIERIYLPVAHAEGKFVPRDEDTFEHLDRQQQLVLRYVGREAGPSPVYPDNPNGSVGHVAGVCDESGRVLGLMPHPERYIDPTHHPRWTREGLAETGAGLRIFQNAVRYFAA